MQQPQTVINCIDLHKTFADDTLRVVVLNGVSLTVKAGELLAILGTSGAGKSTLLHLLGGLDKPSSGRVIIAGQDISTLSEAKKAQLRNKCLGFVYQFHHLLPEFNALENVSMPLLIGKASPKTARQKAADILQKVGLEKRMQHRVGELSGGERQRVALARALVTEPMCVLADEPTGNLDHTTAQQVIELMLSLNQQLKTSLVIVTHDLSLAQRMDRQLTLEDGQLV